jgi:hypothetical protein
MRRILVALMAALMLLDPCPALATPPPTAQEVAEAMRACLPITEVELRHPERGNDEYFYCWVTVDGMPEGFGISPMAPGNNESYHHWWNPEVALSVARWPRGSERPVPNHEMRDWRNRAIRCFFSVPPIPDDFVLKNDPRPGYRHAILRQAQDYGTG